jgi:hypothetical protein
MTERKECDVKQLPYLMYPVPCKELHYPGHECAGLMVWKSLPRAWPLPAPSCWRPRHECLLGPAFLGALATEVCNYRGFSQVQVEQNLLFWQTPRLKYYLIGTIKKILTGVKKYHKMFHDVLSPRTFFPWTFCPVDVFSQGRFVPWASCL